MNGGKRIDGIAENNSRQVSGLMSAHGFWGQIVLGQSFPSLGSQMSYVEWMHCGAPIMEELDVVDFLVPFSAQDFSKETPSPLGGIEESLWEPRTLERGRLRRSWSPHTAQVT